MEAEILLHKVEYNWLDGKETPLQETEVEHIQYMIEQGVSEGSVDEYMPEDEYDESKVRTANWKIKVA